MSICTFIWSFAVIKYWLGQFKCCEELWGIPDLFITTYSGVYHDIMVDGVWCFVPIITSNGAVVDLVEDKAIKMQGARIHSTTGAGSLFDWGSGPGVDHRETTPRRGV